MSITDLHASGFQLSLHFALVGRGSLDVLPLADEVLSLQCDGERIRRVQEGDVVWQNTGARHHLSIGSTYGFNTLSHSQTFFATQIRALSAQVERVEGQLMPGGMHPWFCAKHVETWPHGDSATDVALHNLFGRGRHGWANQQGLDLALPFSSESEFKMLYTALRFLHPLLPALSAASPMAEGARGPVRQCRVAARHDLFCGHSDFALTSLQRHVPPVVDSIEAFEAVVAEPLHAAIRRNGLASILAPDQVSASGLWPNREAEHIAIRLLDGQECVSANVAITGAVQALVRVLSYESSVASEACDRWPAARLDELTQSSISQGESAVFRDADYLHAWGFPEGNRCRAQELLQFLWEDKLASSFDEALAPFLETIVMEGPLASRILQALPQHWNDEALYMVYRNIIACLGNDASFHA